MILFPLVDSLAPPFYYLRGHVFSPSPWQTISGDFSYQQVLLSSKSSWLFSHSMMIFYHHNNFFCFVTCNWQLKVLVCFLFEKICIINYHKAHVVTVVLNMKKQLRNVNTSNGSIITVLQNLSFLEKKVNSVKVSANIGGPHSWCLWW